MKLWPWTRFAEYEAEISSIYSKFVDAELTALELQEVIKTLESKLKNSNERITTLSNQFLQTTADYNVMRSRFQQLEAEVNSKARPSVVLHPPTKYVSERHHQNTGNHEEKLGSHEPLEGLVSAFPFPTASMYGE